MIGCKQFVRGNKIIKLSMTTLTNNDLEKHNNGKTNKIMFRRLGDLKMDLFSFLDNGITRLPKCPHIITLLLHV